MASLGCIRARPLVPGAAVGARPLEHAEMASLGGHCARLLVPGAAVGASPLKHLEMASLGCMLTRLLVPGTAVGASPLEQAKPAIRRKINAPRPPLLQPLLLWCGLLSLLL